MADTLTYPEWAVMEALWDSEPLPLSQVIAKMEGKMDWSYRTYASYLNKLCEKGAVGFEQRGRDKFYYPLVPRGDCIRAESRNLIKKVSPQSKKDLLVCMIEESGLTEEDRKELDALLKKLGGAK